MTSPTSRPDAHSGKPRVAPPPMVTPSCPRWCVTHHAAHAGEEDWLHTGEPLLVADGMSARRCMSIHPDTGEEDGPYVLIGTTELTLAETARLGASLLELANASVPTEHLERALPVLDAELPQHRRDVHAHRRR